nr:ribonuclease H-like domain-containing protein [Tanacetum cinerariifolium]
MSNDDERVDPNLNSDNKSQSDSSYSSVSGENMNITDFLENSGNDVDSSEDIFATQNEKDTQTVKRSSRQSVFSKNYNDFVVESKVKYGLEKYIDAMNQEIDALLRNNTWEIMNLPKDRKAIGSKWIYKIKFRSSGEIDRYKARLVAQGFSQKEGNNFDETFSLVVKMVTVRCLLNVAISNSRHVFQLNVNDAFLYGDLVETITT